MVPKYLLDANTFIESARSYYAFDLAPAFWHALIDHAANGDVCSIDRVKHELTRGNDNLANWAANDFKPYFAPTDQSDVIEAFREIMTWVQRQEQFRSAAKSQFAAGADGWLIAYAKVNGCLVVTQEVFRPDIRRRIPIPNVCRAFSVNTVDTFSLLRALGVRLG